VIAKAIDHASDLLIFNIKVSWL